ncbi:MAG: cupin domain-containing protein [Nitrososphaeraceae archaeon]|jgi:quercetin dioxygenase-like cupin family protein
MGRNNRVDRSWEDNIYNNTQYFKKQMAKMQKKSLDSSPDETRTFEKGKIELVNLGDVTIGRVVLEPGWSWEKCVKPLVKTDSCQAPHTQYLISGRIKVVMDDGAEEEFGPGDAAVIPPGHNAWVVGNEPVVGIDFTGLKEYAKSG